MEKISIVYNQLDDAIDTLHLMIDRYQNPPEHADELEKEAYRDSCIKKFEYSYDTLWKYLKLYLEKKHGLILNSPKPIFQESFKLKIITEEENKAFLSMVDDRNTTSHVYSKQDAIEISNRIVQYYTIIKNVINRLKP